MANRDINPRGIRRPKDGIGGGTGKIGGLRQGRNVDPCQDDSMAGRGFGRGEGRGRGMNRR